MGYLALCQQDKARYLHELRNIDENYHLSFHARANLDESLPENGNPLSNVAIAEKLLRQAEADFDSAQADLDSADNYERKAKEARQRALDKQKIAAMRAIKASGLKGSKESKAEKPDEDSG